MRFALHRPETSTSGVVESVTTPFGALPRWIPAPLAERVKRTSDRLPPSVVAMVDQAREIAQASTMQRSALVAGGLAFFVLLAIAPAAIVVGSLVGLVLSPADLANIAANLSRLSPGAGTELTPYTESLVSIAQASSGAAFSIASAVGVLVALYAASRFLYGLRLAMQGAFHTPHEERTRTSRLAATVATAVGLLVMSAAIVLLAVVQPLLDSIGIRALDIIGTHRIALWALLAAGVLFAVRRTYRRMPGKGRKLQWRAPGVWLATTWIIVVTAGVGFYASRSSTLGAAVAVFGAPIVLMLWLYLCFIGLLLGAQIEASRERRRAAAQTQLTGNASGGPAEGETP